MLFNPDWDKKIKSRENFVTWLGQQPADKVYDYYDPHNCAVAQYLAAHGQESARSWPKLERRLGWFEIVVNHPRTFGAAYQRATTTNWFNRLWLKITAPRWMFV